MKMKEEFKMKKVSVLVNVMPETKRILNELRVSSGLPVGILIDRLVQVYYKEYYVKQNGNGKDERSIHADA